MKPKRIKPHKPDEYSIEQLTRSQLRRQAVLDHLTANPGANFESLTSALQSHNPPLENIAPMTIRAVVAGMIKTCEIAATGPHRAHKYVALVTTTATAEEVRARYLERHRLNNAKNDAKLAAQNKALRIKREAKAAAKDADEAPKLHQWVGGSIKNVAGSLPAGSNQGGQGALRPSVYVRPCHE